MFQSESTLYSCLIVKELLAPSRREIWSLSDCNWTRTQNHLVCKETLNHLTKLASLSNMLSVRLWIKWFWVRIQLQSVIISYLQFWHFSYMFVLLLDQLPTRCPHCLFSPNRNPQSLPWRQDKTSPDSSSVQYKTFYSESSESCWS